MILNIYFCTAISYKFNEKTSHLQSKPKAYLPLVYALVLTGGVFIGYYFKQKSTGINDQGNTASGSKINSLINYITNHYVDTINADQLEEKSVASILKNLDPHSDYIPASEFEITNEPLEGEFDGIGIEFNILNDTITVINPIVGGPSEKIGLKAGDKIVKVNNKLVANTGISNKEVFKLLRGKSGTEVKLSIIRKGQLKLIDFNIVRGKIPLYSLDVAYLLTKDIGYIKISRFAETTYDEYLSAFNKLTKQGMKKLILDLRDNGGGYLNIAVDLADEFLMNGLQIVYTEGLHQRKKTYNATTKGGFENNPLVVLIDEGSASASEIVSGALQDNDRATIIGRRSFGKGLVQDQLNLTDGSAIRLTIARYYTPTGRCIQKPYDKGNDAYYEEELERYNHGELYNKDSIKVDKSKKYTTPKGKVVYGGGGIVPDIFIAADSAKYDKSINLLVYTGNLNAFTFNYTDNNRARLLNKYPTDKAFVEKFNTSDTEITALNNFLKSKKVTQTYSLSNKGLAHLMKAFIGRVLFDKDAYYPIINKTDEAIIKAIEVLDNSKI
jgi:carboxyl-terminal processing protease